MDLSRVEGILKGNKNIVPQSRVEQLLQDLVLGGGSIDYDYLASKIDILTEAEVEQIIQDYLTANPAASGDAVLSADLTANENVGGVKSGKFYAKGTALETIIRDILTSIKVPTLTEPSFKITSFTSSSGKYLFEALGNTLDHLPAASYSDPFTIVLTANRGLINPPYGTSGNRAGTPNRFRSEYTPGFDGVPFVTDSSLDISVSGNTITIRNMVFESGNHIGDEAVIEYYGEVNFNDGEQPKNSDGENYQQPYKGKNNYDEYVWVMSDRKSVEFVRPWYSNAADILTVSKMDLVSKETNKERVIHFPAQTKANPEVFEVPDGWNVTSIEAINPITGQWVDISSEFTVTAEPRTNSAGIVIYYTVFTYNLGIATGARDVRVKWS